MKISIFTFMLPIFTFAQESAFEKFVSRQDAFGKTIPQEKVYVHLDNTYYFQGDTIWFTAYTRQTNTDRPSEVSGVLYVELLNNDGYLVERKLVEMSKGRGNGFFALNNMIQYSGFYELRAYTRWQLNWGEHEHEHPSSYSFMFRDKKMEREYFRDYDKLYSRVFPVYDRPLTPGDYTRDMTLRVMRREFRDDSDKRKLNLSLFPEGGNLIAGVENRVAFEAAMTDGEQVEGILTIGNEQAKTINRGRGVFSIVPGKGMESEVTFVAASGEKVSAKLPKPEEKGVAIKVLQETDCTIIETSPAGLDADSLALTIMHEGKLEKFHALSEGRRLKVEGLSAGIHQVTVFDTRGRVFADRLFFVTKPELSKPTLAVVGLKDRYNPYEKVELRVNGGGQDVPVSLAVRDGSQTDPLFDSGNIMTEMLLSSEIKGFVPNPGWYFESDDEIHRQALDLLMMTQGWRRFVWRDMAINGEWDLTQPDEKAPILVGYIYFNPNRIAYNGFGDDLDLLNLKKRDYKLLLEMARKKITSSLRIHAELIHTNTNETVIGEEPFVGNRFKIPCPKFYGNSILFLSVADSAKWGKDKKDEQDYSWIQMAGYDDGLSSRISRKLNLGESDFRAYISWPYPRFVLPFSFYQSHLPPKPVASEYDVPSELLADSARTLREVQVKARRRSRLKRFDMANPAFLVDAYDAWNTIEDAGIPIFDYKDIRKELVRVYLNDYGTDEEKDGSGDDRIRFQFPRWEAGTPPDSLYHPKYLNSVNDDLELSPGESRTNFGDTIHVVPNEDVRRLIDKYVVYTDYQPRLEGSYRYWGSNRPETRIMIGHYFDESRRLVYRDRCYNLPGFSYPAEFYSPDYSQQTPPEPTDYRRTLYWNPNLQLDKNGEANVTFYNNSRQTTLSIEAEGQAQDGTLLWGEW